MSALRSRNLISQTSEWSTDSIGELIGIVSGPEIQSQFEAFVRHNKPYLADGETKNVIRKLRNKLGLIEIGDLAREVNLTVAQAFEAVRQTYASTVETSSLVLAVLKWTPEIGQFLKMSTDASWRCTCKEEETSSSPTSRPRSLSKR
jgi:hypothetical protein